MKLKKMKVRVRMIFIKNISDIINENEEIKDT